MSTDRQPSPTIDPRRRYLTKTDLSAIVGVTTRTINRWLEDGRLPAPHTQIGQSQVWIREKVLAWIDAGKAATERSA